MHVGIEGHRVPKTFDSKTVGDWLRLWHFRFEITTCANMLEPWEKVILCKLPLSSLIV